MKFFMFKARSWEHNHWIAKNLTHEDKGEDQSHIADRGQVSMSHCNMAHKPISFSKSADLPSSKVAMDRDWSKWRMKHLSVSGMTISNATVLLVDRTLPQLKTPQIIHNSSATIHTSDSFYPQNIKKRWKSRSYTWYKIGVKMRTLPELRLLHDILLDSDKDRWLKHTLTWTKTIVRAEIRTKERLWFCEPPDSPTSLSEPPSSNESCEDDFDYGANIDRVDQHDQWLNAGSSTTTQSWANRSTMARSLAILWLGTPIGLVGPIRTPQLAVASLLQKDHSQETDGHNRHFWWTSWLIPHLLTAICLFLLLWILYVPRARESFATSARSKSQFIALDWLRENWRQECWHGLSRSTSTRIPSWRRLQAWRPVSARFWKSHQGDASRIKLWASGSGWCAQLRWTSCYGKRFFKWKESSSSSKNRRRKIHQEVRWSCKEIQAAEWGGARILQSSVGQKMCKIW